MGLTDTGRNKRRKRQSYRAKAHVYDGFPHFSRVTPVAHCICLQECCQDMRAEDGKGCVCKACPCQYGYPHGVKNVSQVHNEAPDTKCLDVLENAEGTS